MTKTTSLNTHSFENYGFEHCFEFRALNFEFLFKTGFPFKHYKIKR